MAEQLLFGDFAQQGQLFYMADLILGKGEETLPHFHDFYEFQVVLEGSFTEVWNQGELNEKERGAHLICPEDIHYLKGLRNKNRLRNIAVLPELMRDTLELFGLEKEHLKEVQILKEPSWLLFCEKTLYLNRITNVQKRNVIFTNILYDFLYEFLEQEKESHPLPPWLTELKKEMEKEENFMAGTGRMTEISGLTREHIGRCFRKYFNITPSAFLYQCKLQKAASMLLTEKESVLTIAMECGFQNFSYFHRLFKQQFGMSPREYRQKSHRLFIREYN